MKHHRALIAYRSSNMARGSWQGLLSNLLGSNASERSAETQAAVQEQLSRLEVPLSVDGTALDPDLGAAEAPRRRRRWPWVAGGILVVLAAAAASLWFLFVPNWRPPLRDGERYGIDVSNHQGTVDWRAVAEDGIEFAYVKASEGGDFTDARFDANWRAAGEAGLERGAYHFLTLCRSGREQARHFLSVAPPDPAALPPAVDLELAGNCSSRPSPEAVAAEVRGFIEVVEAAWGSEVVVYARDDWESRYPVRDELGRPLWQFRFLRRPSNDGWLIWQIHGFAHVDGVAGGVDLNIMRDS
jgi:lysozyme